MHGMPGSVNAHRLLMAFSLVVCAIGILLPRFRFGEHGVIAIKNNVVLPSLSLRADRIKPELYLEGIPIMELQPRFLPLDQILFFSHIPRTAGGTFSLVLRALFPTAEQMPLSHPGSTIRDLSNLSLATAQDWKRWKVIYSHEDISFVSCIPVPTAVTVFLRDPIKQRRSSFYWGLLKPFRMYHDISSWAVSNDFPCFYQVEWMAGVSRWWPYSHYNEALAIEIWNNKDRMMRLAKTNLARTTWFGITERFNESLCMFHYTHRLRPLNPTEFRSIHRYVTPANGEYTMIATAADLQRPRLKYEYEFFNWAVKLFDLRLADMKKHYQENSRRMKDFIAPECAGVLN